MQEHMHLKQSGLGLPPVQSPLVLQLDSQHGSNMYKCNCVHLCHVSLNVAKASSFLKSPVTLHQAWSKFVYLVMKADSCCGCRIARQMGYHLPY